MGFRFKSLRIKVPSLRQHNAVVTRNDWCGRTSSSMIYNYYYLVAKNATLDEARDQLVANVDRSPSNLVFRDSLPKVKAWYKVGGEQIAAYSNEKSYALLSTLQEGTYLINGDKSVNWHQGAHDGVVPLDPPDKRGSDIPSEREVQTKLAPVINALEAYNPALFYSGLTKGPKHIVVISGYELRRGQLWLHIDDPGQRWTEKGPFGIVDLLTKCLDGVIDGNVIEICPADYMVDENNPGIRYWLRARALFAPNTNTAIPDDTWGDHGDPSHARDGRNRWGLSVYYTDLSTPRRPFVEAVPVASYPVHMPPGSESKPEVLDELWSATAASGSTFPVDKFKIWNNGLRIPRSAVKGPKEDGDKTEAQRKEAEDRAREVLTIVPGQIVAARLGAAAPNEPDRGMVIVRHTWDKRVRDFVNFPESGELDDEQALVFSLYARLARPEEPAKSPLVSLAKPGPEVELVWRVAAGDVVELVAKATDSGDLRILPTVRTVGAPPRDGGGTFAEEDLLQATVDGEPYHIVPVPAGQRNLEHCEDRPQGPQVPDGAALAYHNPIGALIDPATVAAAPRPRLVADLTGATPELVDVAPGEGGSWYAVEPYAEPGLDLSLHRWAAYADPGVLQNRSGALVVRAKSLIFTASEVSGKATIVFGGDKKTVVLSCDGDDQPALEPGAKSGAKATPRLYAIAPESSVDTDENEVRSGAKLSYWDPASGDVYPTTATTKKKIPVRGQRGLPDGFVALDADLPELEVTHKDTFGHEAAEAAALAALAPDLFPLLCVDDPNFYRTTQPKRTFPDSDHVTLKGRVLFRAEPQYVAGRMRAWPKVTAVAFLTPAQAESARTQLATAYDPHRVEIFGRVERGESALVGVFLEGHGWSLEGDIVRVADGWSDSVRLHRVLTYVKGKRGFNEDEANTIDLEPSADLELRAVWVYEGYDEPRALVEIQFATAELGTNAVEVAEYQLRKKVHELLAERLDGDTLCSLESLEKDARALLGDLEGLDRVPEGTALSWRDVAGTAIGHMGRTTAEGDVGVHVEVFSDDYIIPPANAPRWPEVCEATGETPGTQPYFFAQQKEITVNDKLCAGTQRGKACEQDTRKAEEWTKFCTTNQRLLSRIVAYHINQWGIDWDRIKGETDPGHSMGPILAAIPPVERKPLDLAALGIPGLGAQSYYYYHPLRLVEWLTTGMDVAVSNLGEGAAKQLRAYLDIDDEPMDLLQPVEGEPFFSLRVVVNDATHRSGKLPGQKAVLLLDGLRTSPKHEQIAVLLKRGRIGQYSFTEPGATIALAQDEPGYGLPEELGHVRSEYGSEVHLLGDGNAKLEDSGVSCAVAAATARYNRARPAVALAALASDAFKIVKRRVIGAAASGPNSEFIVPPPEELGSTDEEVRYPMQSRTVSVITTVAPPRSTSASTTLEVKFIGGDLESDVSLQLTISTREIAFADQGEDVAKVQLYLSRIRIEGVPCFVRLQNDKGKPIRERRPISGVYEEGTAEALWRFILYFSRTNEWCASTVITTSTGEVDVTPDDCTSVEEKTAELLAAGEYPVVTQEIIDELVEHYRLPWVPPSLVFGDPTRQLQGPGLPLASIKKWNEWSPQQKTTLLPHVDAPSIHLPVTLLEETDGTDALRVEVVVKEEEGYEIAEPVPHTVAELLGGITLRPSGVLTPAKTKPRIEVYACHREIHLLSLELGGVPNLRQSPVDGYAAAALQDFMAAKGAYKTTVDGEWGTKSKKALGAMAAEYGCTKNAQYIELVTRIVEPESEP